MAHKIYATDAARANTHHAQQALSVTNPSGWKSNYTRGPVASKATIIALVTKAVEAKFGNREGLTVLLSAPHHYDDSMGTYANAAIPRVIAHVGIGPRTVDELERNSLGDFVINASKANPRIIKDETHELGETYEPRVKRNSGSAGDVERFAPVPIAPDTWYQPVSRADAMLVNVSPAARHALCASTAAKDAMAATKLAAAGDIPGAMASAQGFWQAMIGVMAPF